MGAANPSARRGVPRQVASSTASSTSSIRRASASSTFSLSITATPASPAHAGEVVLERADLVEGRQIALRRPRARAVREVAPVELLVLHHEERLHEHAAARAGRLGTRARQHVHALQDHRLGLVGGPLDDRRDGGGHVLRLVGVALEPARVEGRVMHRRHRLLGEERAQHLPDHVGGDHAVDPQAAGQHRRERGLADPGGAADQHHERAVEAVEPAPAAVAAHGALALLRAQHLLAELVEAVHVDLAVAALAPAARSTARASSNERSGESPMADSALRHQALRVGQAVALVEDDRLSRHRRRSRAGPRRCRSRAVAHEHDPSALAPAPPGDGVDRGRLQLGEVDVAAARRAARSRSRASAPAPGQVGGRHHRLDSLARRRRRS